MAGGGRQQLLLWVPASLRPTGPTGVGAAARDLWGSTRSVGRCEGCGAVRPPPSPDRFRPRSARSSTRYLRSPPPPEAERALRGAVPAKTPSVRRLPASVRESPPLFDDPLPRFGNLRQQFGNPRRRFGNLRPAFGILRFFSAIVPFYCEEGVCGDVGWICGALWGLAGLYGALWGGYGALCLPVGVLWVITWFIRTLNNLYRAL